MEQTNEKIMIQIPPLPKDVHPDHVKLIWSYLIQSAAQREDMVRLIKKICDDGNQADFTDLIEYAQEKQLNDFYDGLIQIIVDCMIQSCHLATCLYYALYVRNDTLADFKERAAEAGVAGPFYPYLEAMAEWMGNMQKLIDESER